jgi:hypothetical protein
MEMSREASKDVQHTALPVNGSNGKANAHYA